MFKSILIATALMQASATQVGAEDHKIMAMRPSMIDEINAMKTTWTAAMPIKFANATVADVKKLLGTVLPHEEGFYEPELIKTNFKYKGDAIPESFDARTNWPQCAGIIGRVRDQSDCGSCWAFGSTEAFNDRHCIATGDTTTVFAPEDTNSCCSGLHCGMSMGCNGGQPSGAWKWFTQTGVSSGLDWADMNTGNSCKPYSMQSCAHHVSPPEGMVACDTLEEYDTPKCISTCSDTKYTKNSYADDKVKAATSYSIAKKDVAAMQSELMEHGTLSVSLTVYEDFEAYNGGVYQHVTGKSLGGHAIKMIGWGVDNGTPYWLCVNSWNKSWGDKNDGGTFKIKRGSDECGIESGVVAGTFASK